MAYINIKIEGLDEIVKHLKAVDTDTQQILSQAARTGAEIALSDAKANAPFKTGELKNSLDIREERSKKVKRVWRIWTKTPYAMKAEWRYKPYLRPSIDNNKTSIVNSILNFVKSVIK